VSSCYSTPATPAIAQDFALTPDVDATLNALALHARDDADARNALHAALAFKIARFVGRYRHWHSDAWELADLEQEAFIILVEMVADWRGTGSFGAYFLGFFPWRLRHAIEWWGRRRPPGPRMDPTALGHVAAREWPGEPHDALALAVTLMAYEAHLTPRDHALVRLHVLHGAPLDSIAYFAHMARRTVYRRWGRIARILADGGR
jgi:DNA-directed RNA polymerase specialized sigma24 family protein